MNRRHFIRAAAASVVAAGTGISYGVYYADTHEVEVTTVPMALGLRKAMRAVVIGDIHFDPQHDVDYIRKVVVLVNSLRPDILLYTGDFITANASRIDVLSKALAEVVAPLGCYTVPGNREHWTGIEHILGSLAVYAGVRALQNVSIPLPGNEGFYLTGIDSYVSGRPDPSVIQRSPADSKHIVLVHEPDSFTQLTDARIKLQISGHTHGGQVRVPLIGALILPKMGHHFQTGLFERDGRKLYVNRGIGTLMPHLRVNCRPEITVFELS